MVEDDGKSEQGPGVRVRRLRPQGGETHDGRLRFLAHALTLRAVRDSSDGCPHLRHSARGARHGWPEGQRERRTLHGPRSDLGRQRVLRAAAHVGQVEGGDVGRAGDLPQEPPRAHPLDEEWHGLQLLLANGCSGVREAHRLHDGGSSTLQVLRCCWQGQCSSRLAGGKQFGESPLAFCFNMSTQNYSKVLLRSVSRAGAP
mmetsp:Transcript_19728/g.51777  ORF Transcript_19728/g.51777 Transcript_19728/m.51777 type:complete len:201 (+) Transcript_19728:1323-1925(+)